jgi:DNA-directed RNA polymerase specialized sigma24 family protein
MTTTEDPGCGCAWGWIEDHAALIRQISACEGRRGAPTIEPEDLHGEVLLDLVRVYEQFDPTRGSPRKWIWMRVRRVIRTLLRRGFRNPPPAPETVWGSLAIPDALRGSAWHAEARAEIGLALRRATPIQREAAFVVARDLSEESSRRMIGMGTYKARKLLSALGAHGVPDGIPSTPPA